MSQLLRFVKYAAAILLVSTNIFLVGVTTQVLVMKIKIVTPTKIVVVLTNKIAAAYFTNRKVAGFTKYFFQCMSNRRI